MLDIDALEPGSVTGWAAYPAGVAWALRQAGYLAGGADLAIDADLPAGAGLSSSAALECSVALALTELYQVPVPRRELADLARRAENEFAGAPTGIMDQLAALLGRAGHALLLDCRTGTTEAVPLDPAAAGLTLLIIDTRARHALGDGQYGHRRQACEAAAARLGVRSLRDVVADPGALARLADPALRSVCEHVIAENGRVLRAAGLLRAGDLAAVGDLLTASHRSLRYRFRMSWPQADAAVEAAIDHGALGARMTGGGFGGSVVALVPADRCAGAPGGGRAVRPVPVADPALSRTRCPRAVPAGRGERQAGRRPLRGLGHRRGQLQLHTVRILEWKHVDAERRQAGDLAVRHTVLVEEPRRPLQVVAAGDAEAEMIKAHPVRVEPVAGRCHRPQTQ